MTRAMVANFMRDLKGTLRKKHVTSVEVACAMRLSQHNAVAWLGAAVHFGYMTHENGSYTLV